MRWIRKHFYSSYVPWRLLGLLVLIGLAINIYYLTRTATLSGTVRPERAAYITGAIGVFYAFALGMLCLKGSRSAPQGTRISSQRLSPILLAMVLWCYSLSQIVWVAVLLITRQYPAFPSPEHFTQLGIYPCYIGAILLLPARNLSPWSRLRVFLDSLMIMVAISTLCYYFLLAPLLVNGDGTPLEKAIGGTFVAADLVLMFCLLLVALRSDEPELRPVLVMFFLSILAFFIVHVVHLYELLYLGYNEFSRVDAGLTFIGALLVGTAQTTTNILNKRAITEKPAPEQSAQAGTIGAPLVPWRGKAALPSVLVLIFGLLIFIIGLSGGQKAFPGQMLIVYAGGFVVLILMVLRQFMTLYQISALRIKLQGKNRSLHGLNLRLEQQATTDLLTGLPNHRGLVESLDGALAHAQATHSSCAVIFMDIDHFKSINDHYGHTAGDLALRQFGEIARACLPPGASVGRWGGEEFVVILPDTDPLEALNVAAEIRARTDHHLLVGEKATSATCSLGVASYPQDASTRASLITLADRAMYAAKRLGRNQVRIACEPLVLALNRPEAEAEAAEKMERQATVNALFALLEACDRPTSLHTRRVAALSYKLALALNLSEHEAHIISLGGLLHDLGKIAIPNPVSDERGQLDLEREERACTLQHPLAGAAILAPVPSLQDVATIVRTHHERLDGSGCPNGLRGEEIPLGARIVAVADTYDALTSQHTYRPARNSTRALRELRENSGTQFDPRVVEALAGLLAAVPHFSASDVA